MEFKPHNYQKTAIEHIIKNRNSGLLLDMGMGKTVSTLTAASRLIDGFEVRKVLIIAPKLVAMQTWPAEIRKWPHTQHLRYSVVAGDATKRKMALMREADIYTMGRDNVPWLVHEYARKPWPFDMVVLDESSSFKNPQSMRFKALKRILPHCFRIVILTGTPAPNSLEDLWSQIYLLDRGQRLGSTLTRYREAYFRKKFNGFGWELREGCEKFIHERLADICISMQARDYLDLPERIDVVQKVQLARMDLYKQFVKDEVLKLENATEEEITPMSAAALYSKLLQFCNGAVYDETKKSHEVDTTKLQAVQEAVEALQGSPCIVFYQFRSDIPRLRAAIPEAEEMNGDPAMVDKWNEGKVKVLLAHAASMGHGLNLQHGGHHMFWFGLPWALEQYQQAVARLDRQGQTKPVVNVRFICEGTVEELVLERLAKKAVTQDELIEALKKHIL